MLVKNTKTRKKHAVAPICFLLVCFFSAFLQQANAQAKLEAKFIQSAIVAQAGSTETIGNFEEETDGLWKSYINKTSRKYTELSRDQWSVYLKAVDNQENIALDFWQMRVSINGTIRYAITKASDEVIPGEDGEDGPAPAAVNPPTPPNGKTVQSAMVANMGSTAAVGTYEKEAGGLWRSNLNNNIRKYQETGRDDWSVYLTATDNQETVAIDLWQKRVSVNGTAKYSLTGASTQGAVGVAATTTGGGPTTNPVVNTNPPVATNTNEQDISNYINGLNYDPLVLLSVRENKSTEAMPAAPTKNRTPKENGVIICTKIAQKLEATMENISIFKPTSGIIFPGALVLADRKLAEGLPTPITLKRAPVTLRLDLPGLTNMGTKVVSSPKNSSVQESINQLLEEWHRNPASQGYTNPSASKGKFEKAYSSEQLALSLGFRLEWANNFVSAAAKVNTSSETDVAVAFFQQVYYTITIDLPERPSEVFDPTVSLADLRNVSGNAAPPAYVRSVDYGRTIMVRMESSQKMHSVQLEAALNYATAGGLSISGNTKDTITNIIRNSRFTVYTVGGNSQNTAPLAFAGLEDLSKLQAVISKDAVYRRDNPGVPIAYTVGFLKDNSTAAIKSTSDYVETECTEYANGFIKLKHDGAYVGRFNVTWQEPNKDGVLVNATPFNSGEKTSGYTFTLPLPGDAVNIKIKGEAATGLVWDPWGEAINITERGPTNCTYVIKGTTLARDKDIINCPKK
ncbi:MAG: thiol-activated cytolysin family protein [Ferruginibacter sp.]|nr:thiol-activated cytolysin family protein [Chitinophagaceae bacterium]